MEKLTIEIPTLNSHTFTVSNSYLPPENSYYLQRASISLSELQPDTNMHEVIFADVEAHDTAWDQIANPNARGVYLVNAAMDASGTFLKDPSSPQDKIQQLALSLLLPLRSSKPPFETDTIGKNSTPHRQTIVPS